MRVTQMFYCQICQATEQITYDADTTRPQHIQGPPREWISVRWRYFTTDICPACAGQLSDAIETLRQAHAAAPAPVAALTD